MEKKNNLLIFQFISIIDKPIAIVKEKNNFIFIEKKKKKHQKNLYFINILLTHMSIEKEKRQCLY